MAITVQHKRDTASNWTSNNPTLAAGQFGFETDTGKLKLGDGSTAWSSLNYFEPTIVPWAYQGENYGYTAGGNNNNPFAKIDVVDKFPFSSDSNATDVGDLTVARGGGGGLSSETDGYAAGGDTWSPSNPYYGRKNIVDKTPFSSDENMTDVGDLQGTKFGGVGSASSSENGYLFGGCGSPAPTGPGGHSQEQIDKFPFSGTFSITDVGDLSHDSPTSTCYTLESAGVTSSTHGYRAGGMYSSIGSTKLDKFSFSSDGNATDVGDLTDAIYGASGTSSSDAGYVSGGRQFSGPVSQTKVQCTPFASDTGTTCVGALVQGQHYGAASQSSTTAGYATAGSLPFTGTPITAGNIIQKFPFSAEGNSTDVGDLTCARGNNVGGCGMGFHY